jgi:Winged helix DNA-binding domain
MVVTYPRGGSLADVRAARRALYAKFEPSVLLYALWGAVFALFYGSKSLPLTLAAAAILPTASVAATWWQAKRTRLICPRRLRLFSSRVFLLTSLLGVLSVIIVSAIVVVAVAASLHWWTWSAAGAHRGTPMSYLLPFVVFMAPVIVAASLPWLIDPYGIDARTMRKTPDQPAVGDPLVEPRQQTILCAMLAAVDWIDAGFLATTLRIDDEELSEQTVELVAAQYINVHAYDGRWWFGLTAVGRSAYRRHMRALVSTEQPAVAPDVIPLTDEPVVVEVETPAAPVDLECG